MQVFTVVNALLMSKTKVKVRFKVLVLLKPLLMQMLCKAVCFECLRLN